MFIVYLRNVQHLPKNVTRTLKNEHAFELRKNEEKTRIQKNQRKSTNTKKKYTKKKEIRNRRNKRGKKIYLITKR